MNYTTDDQGISLKIAITEGHRDETLVLMEPRSIIQRRQNSDSANAERPEQMDGRGTSGEEQGHCGYKKGRCRKWCRGSPSGVPSRLPPLFWPTRGVAAAASAAAVRVHDQTHLGGEERKRDEAPSELV